MTKLDIGKIANENNTLIHELEKELIDIYLIIGEDDDNLESRNLKRAMKQIADIKLNNKIMGGLKQ